MRRINTWKRIWLNLLRTWTGPRYKVDDFENQSQRSNYWWGPCRKRENPGSDRQERSIKLKQETGLTNGRWKDPQSCKVDESRRRRSWWKCYKDQQRIRVTDQEAPRNKGSITDDHSDFIRERRNELGPELCAALGRAAQQGFWTLSSWPQHLVHLPHLTPVVGLRQTTWGRRWWSRSALWEDWQSIWCSQIHRGWQRYP